MAIPTPIVEIAFDASPYVVSPTWTDVTTYVRSATTSRGRSDDFGDFDTGTASVVLSNNARLFDPFYTAGSYYGKLLPRRQIRIRATSGGTTYDIFRGFVSGWPVSYTDAGKDSTVTLQCFDALGLLATEEITTDNYQREATFNADPSTLRHYYKCDDTDTSTTLIDRGFGAQNLLQIGALPFQMLPPQMSGLVGSSASCLRYETTAVATTSPTRFALTFIGQPTSANDTGNTVEYQINAQRVLFSIGSANGSLTVTYNPSATVQRVTTLAAGTFNPNVPHHFAFQTFSGSNNATILVDGINVTNFVDSVVARSENTEFLKIRNMRIQEILVQTEHNAFLYEIANGFKENSTYQRSGDYLAQTSFTNFAYSAGYPIAPPDDPVVMVNQIENVGSLMPQLRRNANSEGGEIFCRKDGTLLFTSRNYKYGSTKSANIQATFSDAGGATLKYGTDLLLDYDADSIRNSVQVDYSSITGQTNSVTVLNTTSTASVGKVADVIDTYLATETDATTLANLQLGVGAALKPRISPIEVGLSDANADWQTILGLELLERIKLVRTPSVGNNIELLLLINSISHTMTPKQMQTTITGSVRYTGWFTLDVSLLDGTAVLI